MIFSEIPKKGGTRDLSKSNDPNTTLFTIGLLREQIRFLETRARKQGTSPKGKKVHFSQIQIEVPTIVFLATPVPGQTRNTNTESLAMVKAPYLAPKLTSIIRETETIKVIREPTIPKTPGILTTKRKTIIVYLVTALTTGINTILRSTIHLTLSLEANGETPTSLDQSLPCSENQQITTAGISKNHHFSEVTGTTETTTTVLAESLEEEGTATGQGQSLRPPIKPRLSQEVHN